jgi:hypothetical protein
MGRVAELGFLDVDTNIMEIDYTNSRADYMVHSRFASGAASSRLAFQHYMWVAYWGVMAGLGVSVSLFADLIFMAAIFTSMFLFYLVRAVPYSRVLQAAADRSALLRGVKKIRLRLDDEGLHETVEEQVQSFAPWSAFRRFAVVDEHLLIELAGDLWANVPRSSVAQGDAAFEKVVTILRSRGIPEFRQ